MEEVFAGNEAPRLRAALDQLIGQADGHLKTAFELLASAPADIRPLFLPLAQVGRDLKRMSRADAKLFTPQATSRLRTLWNLWRASRTPPFASS